MEVMKQKHTDWHTGETYIDEVWDRSIILREDDYTRLLKALRTSKDQRAKELARELFLTRTHLRRCVKCGDVSYTAAPACIYPHTAGLDGHDYMCAWCAHKVFPEIVRSPARYGKPAQVFISQKGYRRFQTKIEEIKNE